MLIFSTARPAALLAGRGVWFFATQKQSSRLAMKTFYQTLGVTEDCEDETLRLTFVHLAKRFHPDSGTKEASADRFSEIENAYRQIQRHRFEEREKDTTRHPEAEEFDIKHTAPQHRHYLVHNVGIGTPNLRQKRFVADRAQKAVLSVMEHRLKKIQAAERNSLVGMDKQRAKDVKTRFGMDRLVEDLIQESMSKGEFSDLRGMGKPLKPNTCGENPYVDFVTHKLNQVLLDNGFTPEWIQLSKEIREDTDNLKKRLEDVRNTLGDLPLSHHDDKEWQDALRDIVTEVKRINKNIDKYNLIVPILQKQMLQVNLKSLADAALAKPSPPSVDKNSIRKSDARINTLTATNEPEGIMQVLTYIFSK